MSKNTQQIRAYIGLTIMTLIVGLSFIFIKIGLKYVNVTDLLAHRFTAAFVSIVLLRIFNIIKTPQFNIQKFKVLLLLSLFYPLMFFSFQAYGMVHSSASEAGIVFSSIPIITLIAAGIFLKEKTSWLQKIGIILSVFGILYIIYHKTDFSGYETNLKSILILLLSVCSIVAYYIIGKSLGTRFSPIEITIWITVIAFIVFNSWSITNHLYNNTINDYIKPLFQAEFLWTILYLGILSTTLTSFLTNFALPVIPTAKISIFNNLSPIIAVFSGILLLNEQFFSYHIIGGLSVITGVIITLIFKPKTTKN